MSNIGLYLKYLKGHTLDQALGVVRKYNEQGISCCLSYLPITKYDKRGVDHDINMYKRVLAKIYDRNLDCDITIKPKQFGILENLALARQSIIAVLKEAGRYNNFVWLDMETPDLIGDTLRLFTDLKKYPNLAICLQAYLRRTGVDLNGLLEGQVAIRLVKGFYKGANIKKWREVSQNYIALLDNLIKKSSRPAIATHDLEALSAGLNLVREYGRKKQAEFQFFMGLRDQLANKLVSAGYKVRVYVPFGPTWPYLRDGYKTFDNWRYFQRVLGIKKLRP